MKRSAAHRVRLTRYRNTESLL